MWPAEPDFIRLALRIKLFLFYPLGIFLISPLLTAQPSPMHFENLTIQDGLSNNWVRPGGNILQDTMGFLWIGTQNGLNRYDGSTFKDYRHDPDKVSSLSDNNIWALYLDRSHRLWIATNTGVDRYDPLKDLFVRYELIREGDTPSDLLFPSAILEDSHGNFLLGGGAGLYQLDRQRRFTNTGLVPSCWVSTLLEDRHGQLWVGSREGHSGLYVFNWQEEKGWVLHRRFYREEEKGKGLQDDQVLKVFEDSRGDIWIATLRGLDRYDRESNSFTHFMNGLRINDIEEDAEGQLWITANDIGLYIVDATREKFTSLISTPSKRLTEIYLNQNNEAWLGSVNSGFYYSNEYFPTFKVFKNEPDLFFTIQTNHIKDQIRRVGTYFFEPNDGPVWIASRRSLYRFDKERYSFSRLEASVHIQSNIAGINERADGSVWILANHGLYLFTPGEKRITPYLENQTFQHFAEDKHGNLWLDDEQGSSLIRFHTNEKENFKRYPVCRHDSRKENRGRHISFIQEDKNDNVWIGTIHGLYRYDWESDTVLSCHLDEGAVDATGEGYFFGAYEDSQERWWTYTGEAVYRFLPEENTFARYAKNQASRKGLSSYTKNWFFEDSQKGLWVATFGGGLNKYDETNDAFISLVHDPDDPTSISNNDILDLYEDSQKRLWVATKGGLNRWDRQSKTFARWTTAHGLIANDIGSILEDKDSLLWLGTGGGLSKFDPENHTFSNYTYRDGLPDSYLFWNIHYVSLKGTIFFLQRPGQQQSFFVFHPQRLRRNPDPPKVAFTGFQLFHKPLAIRGTSGDTLEWGSPLLQHMAYTQEIELEHWQNDFSIEFSALSFLQPQKNKFLYKLEGYNNHWIETTAGERRASYTNIAPGTYTLQVKAANNDGIWDEEGISLDIYIHPPRYWAWWSKTLYFILGSLLLLGVYQFQLNRRLALAEAKRLRDLDEVKTQLYTNFTHEFRTPLTVILGMADEIKSDPQKWFHEGIEMIKRNGHNLLHLVNQMLDLRKLETGNLPVEMDQGDIIAYLKYIAEPFHFYAETKNISLIVSGVEESLMMDYDPEKTKEIVSNLLSNAIKFTPEGGKSYLIVKSIRPAVGDWPQISEVLELTVKDTGIGIPAEQLPHIFDRFYQVDGAAIRQARGTGIGLALTKELVKLLGGDIRVTSEVDAGTEFVVHLPITRNGKVLAGEPEKAWPDDITAFLPVFAGADGAEQKPLILIVEDHQDITVYLQSCLQMDYELAFASDGQQGAQKARELIPDLIVSDIMMPQKDGYELTNDLKSDFRTSHIPIILLTAKADQDSRMQGLEKGADAYLTKPFHREELLIRIKKLIELRKQLQRRYQDFSFAKPGRAGSNDLEYDFLQKINASLQANLNNENFGIPQLCRAVGISRTQLHRKLKALTGKSASHYIRSYRLSKAKELLLTSNLNVTEVSIEVGFKHLSHFTAAFKKEFDINPSEI